MIAAGCAGDIQPAGSPPVTTGPEAVSTSTPFSVEGGAVMILIDDGGYVPSIITVPVGTTVCWDNPEYDDHTVTSTTGYFDFYAYACTGPFCITFFYPGTYHYYDALYPEFMGDVIVK